jgi:hypothetical protein
MTSQPNSYRKMKAAPRVEDVLAAGFSQGDDVVITLTDFTEIDAVIEGAWERHGERGKQHVTLDRGQLATAIVVRRRHALAPTKILLKDVREIDTNCGANGATAVQVPLSTPRGRK